MSRNETLSKESISKQSIIKIIALTSVFSLILFLLKYNDVFGYSRDQFNYMDMIETLITKGCRNSDGTATIINVDIGFQEEICILSYITKDAKIIYSLQGFISIFVKLVFFSIVTISIPVSKFKNRTIPLLMGLLVYFLRYFPLHEFTQIRISIAISLMMISIGFIVPISSIYTDIIPVPVTWKKRFQPLIFSLILAISISLHFSILMVIPFIISTIKIKTRKNFLIAVLIVASVGFLLTGIAYIIMLNFFPLIAEQKNYLDNFDDTNIFSIVKILDILSVAVAFWLIDFRIPIQVFCLSAMAYSLILFYCTNLSNLPTVYSFRVSEILIVFNAVLVASLQDKKQMVWIGSIILAASIKNFAFYLDNSFFVR